MDSRIGPITVIAFCLGGAIPTPAQETGTRLEVLDRWQGTSRNDGLREQGPDRPFILDSETWAQVWTAWRPQDDLPEIDFDQDLVLVATVDGPNRLFGPVYLSPNGDVQIRLASTKVGGPGFGYLLMRVARDGIVSVNRQEVEKGEDTLPEFIRVEIKGQLRTDVAAIGGETTGVTVSALNLTFELYFGENADLRDAAEPLNGQTVLVTGRLEGRRGVEIPIRQVLIVESLVSADSGSDNSFPAP